MEGYSSDRRCPGPVFRHRRRVFRYLDRQFPVVDRHPRRLLGVGEGQKQEILPREHDHRRTALRVSCEEGFKSSSVVQSSSRRSRSCRFRRRFRPVLNAVAVRSHSRLALPWLINRGLRFNAAMTSWSNVRFRFEGQLLAGSRGVPSSIRSLQSFSLYLAFPFVARASSRYTIGRHSLGGHRFAFESGIGPFYRSFSVRRLSG